MSAPFGDLPDAEERARRRRQSQEDYLRKLGWDRLVERADVWVNLRAGGDEIHSVHLFRTAFHLELAADAIRKKAAKRRAAAIHTHPGRTD